MPAVRRGSMRCSAGIFFLSLFAIWLYRIFTWFVYAFIYIAIQIWNLLIFFLIRSDLGSQCTSSVIRSLTWAALEFAITSTPSLEKATHASRTTPSKSKTLRMDQSKSLFPTSTDCAWCNKNGWQCEQNSITGPDSKKGSRCQASEPHPNTKVSQSIKVSSLKINHYFDVMLRDQPEVLRVSARRLQAHRLLRPQCHLQEEGQCEFK